MRSSLLPWDYLHKVINESRRWNFRGSSSDGKVNKKTENVAKEAS